MTAIKTIRATDAGDGSNSFHITYEDGSTAYLNEDIPYDGYVDFHFENNKPTTTTVNWGD